MSNNYAEKSGPELAEALANIRKMSDLLKESNLPSKREPPQVPAMKTPPPTTTALQVQPSKEPPAKSDGRIDFEKQFKPATWESMIDIAWYNGALSAQASGTTINPIPGMFYGKGGKPMMAALRDPAKRKLVYDAILSRHIGDAEMMIQLCNTVIAGIKDTEVAVAMKDPNSLLHAAVNLKKKLEDGQRNAMLTDLKLRGASSSPVNIEQAGQIFFGQPPVDQKQDGIGNCGKRPLPPNALPELEDE